MEMPEPEFKIYEEDLLEASQQIEQLNKEIIDLKELLKSFDNISSEQAPFIKELEEEIIDIKRSVELAKESLIKSEEHQYSVRKYTAFISGGLGSLAGGSVGMILIPIIGPTTPLITSLVGGVAGIIYSLIE
jgi:hypothetical protein